MYEEFVEVRNIKELKNLTLQVALAFKIPGLGDVVIKGFRISVSPKYSGLWVQPPRIRNNYGKYQDIFFMENMGIWRAIERMLIDIYKEHFPDSGIDIETLTEEIL